MGKPHEKNSKRDRLNGGVITQQTKKPRISRYAAKQLRNAERSMHVGPPEEIAPLDDVPPPPRPEITAVTTCIFRSYAFLHAEEGDPSSAVAPGNRIFVPEDVLRRCFPGKIKEGDRVRAAIEIGPRGPRATKVLPLE